MVDHGSNGKRTIDDEKQFEKIEQRLDGIDETLRNLTQMVAALTIKKKHEPMKRRLDQRCNWQKNGYNDQHRNQWQRHDSHESNRKSQFSRALSITSV
ncbi:unnamed protein product, partial [Vitis vinifera]|uniref:Uncharacterized protein n=1 Tax=Vitis vinifera TaxID=29760 RepID=D7U4B9_VITVI